MSGICLVNTTILTGHNCPIIDFSAPRRSYEVVPKHPAYVMGELIRCCFDKVCHLASRILCNLQTHINTLGWSEPLTVFPPKPTRSYPIKEKEAENWINAHTCEKQQKAARTLVKATRHISQPEFEQELKKSVDQFNAWLESQNNQDYLLVVTHKQKSNHWVAQLALPHLKVLPRQVINIKHHELPKHLIEYHQQHPEIDKIVFFDDAAYGCSQSKYLICQLSKLDWISECGDSGNLCEKSRIHADKKYTIAAIIPFMRDPRCVLPSSNVEEVCYPKPKDDKHVRVFTSQKIAPVGDILTKEESDSIGCGSDRIPVYFDHKMPDFVSTCEAIYKEGKVTNRGDSERGYCEKDWEPKPSVWRRIYHYLFGNPYFQASEASRRYEQRRREIEQATEGMDTKFIDDIHPPYKSK
jgi:hypothetical protein